MTHMLSTEDNKNMYMLHCKNGVFAPYVRHVLAIDMSSTIEIKENRTNKDIL